MFNFLSSKKNADGANDGDSELDSTSKAVIQYMSSDSEDSQSSPEPEPKIAAVKEDVKKTEQDESSDSEEVEEEKPKAKPKPKPKAAKSAKNVEVKVEQKDSGENVKAKPKPKIKPEQAQHEEEGSENLGSHSEEQEPKPKAKGKNPKVLTRLPDDSESSSSSDSDDESEDSVELPKSTRIELSSSDSDSDSSDSSDESSDSEEVSTEKEVEDPKPELEKPKQKAKPAQNVVGKPAPVQAKNKKNRKDENEAFMPKKKIRLSDAKFETLKKDGSAKPKDEVFCGGLPFNISEEQVRDLFEDDCGEIVKINVLDGKGIAFIKFTKEEFASKAVEYDGTEFMGRKLRINLSSEKGKQQPLRRQSSNANYSGDNPPTNEICVRNISYSTTEDTMREVFSECGNVTRCHIPVYEDTGKPLGKCFITFDTVEEATKALQFDNTEIDGRSVFISYTTPRPPRGSGGIRGKGGDGGFKGKRFDNAGGGRGPRQAQASSPQIAEPGSKSIIFDDDDD